MEAPWTKSGEQILQYFAVDPTRGLTSDAAAKHAELYGKNGKSHLILALRLMGPLITPYFARASGRPANSSLGTHPRTVQGPACAYPSRFRCRVVCFGSLRRI